MFTQRIVNAHWFVWLVVAWFYILPFFLSLVGVLFFFCYFFLFVIFFYVFFVSFSIDYLTRRGDATSETWFYGCVSFNWAHGNRSFLYYSFPSRTNRRTLSIFHLSSSARTQIHPFMWCDSPRSCKKIYIYYCTHVAKKVFFKNIMNGEKSTKKKKNQKTKT